jgi:hypothetical protein
LTPLKPFHCGVGGSLSRGYECFIAEFYEGENDPSAGVVDRVRFGASTFLDRWLATLGEAGERNSLAEKRLVRVGVGC